MPRRGRSGRGAPQRRRKRQPGPGRPLSGACIVRRAYSVGNLPYPGPSDAGGQIGVTPSAVLDWSAFSATWKRFRVLSATVHFVQNGHNDATPGFSTLYIYHDVVSSGAPATILDALVQRRRRILAFGSNKMHHQFTFKPLPWTDSTFGMTLASASSTWLPVGGSAPLTSASYWLQNYNNALSSPGLNVTVELLLHFDAPQ